MFFAYDKEHSRYVFPGLWLFGHTMSNYDTSDIPATFDIGFIV